MTTIIAKHDDNGTEVSVYKGELLSDRYYVNIEDGNWRDGVPKDAIVREYTRS